MKIWTLIRPRKSSHLSDKKKLSKSDTPARRQHFSSVVIFDDKIHRIHSPSPYKWVPGNRLMAFMIKIATKV